MQLGGVEIAFMSVEFFGGIGLFLGLTEIIWVPLASIAMLLLTPKTLVEKYFMDSYRLPLSGPIN